ncbi:GDSL-type esterase/lipase family protein [Flavitalea sp. BT771]|uniref:GDSL-type esterase/lipase family protein n=1 Tax=Flavitalea sp. BT771 TaxID=3063329 RepID=UPI0026E23F72|nr:GDSL-type esterase/lipase family protein [Flavitalea sp. BT771]MDO6435011.1 GDSL-type esterase/lipase family protein [Flavitalea sp. BT771]MDV6223911.1 GDSL-type esterase/lipase family protein [Flavitalea sp. BT771]
MIWYENEVQRLEKEKTALEYEPKMVFYGSSSIRLWETLYEDFKEYSPVNLGFGGSTLAACVWFFERLVTGYRPQSILLYAGDNDLGDGRHPEEVFIFFQQMVALTRLHFGDIPLAFISIKPSITRWNIVDSIRYTNTLIENEIRKQGNNLHYIDIYHKMTDKAGYPKREFLDPDGLHISEKGYALWKDIIQQHLSAFIR